MNPYIVAGFMSKVAMNKLIVEHGPRMLGQDKYKVLKEVNRMLFRIKKGKKVKLGVK